MSEVKTKEKTEHEIKKWYAGIALGLGLVPIYLQGKRPFIPGWPNRTLEQAKVSFKKHNGWRDQYNIGVITGKKSNITVIDVEEPDVQSFISVVNDFGGFPRTLTVCTGNSGCHYYFSFLEGTRNTVRKPIKSPSGIVSKFDVRSDGGVIVFAGSIHESTGQRYVLDESMSYNEDGDIVIADMPEWLKKVLYS